MGNENFIKNITDLADAIKTLENTKKEIGELKSEKSRLNSEINLLNRDYNEKINIFNKFKQEQVAETNRLKDELANIRNAKNTIDVEIKAQRDSNIQFKASLESQKYSLDSRENSLMVREEYLSNSQREVERQKVIIRKVIDFLKIAENL